MNNIIYNTDAFSWKSQLKNSISLFLFLKFRRVHLNFIGEFSNPLSC